MSGLLTFLAIVGVGVALFALVLALAVKQVRQATEHLRALAARTGLAVHERPARLGMAQVPELRGELRGKAVRVYAYTTGSGKSRTDWAAVAVMPVRRSALSFRISPQGFGSRVLTLLGAREIEIGEPDFDGRWFIQTNAPEFLQAALIPELRTKLNAIADAGGKGSYETVETGIRYAERGYFSERGRGERFARVIDACCDLADVAEVFADQPPAA